MLASGEESTVVWTGLVCVAVSIVVHGITGTPVMNRLEGEASAEAKARPAG